MIFVSVASKGLRVHVSGLELTLARIPISVDSKWVSPAVNLSSGEAYVGQGGPSSAGKTRKAPKRSIPFVTGVHYGKANYFTKIIYQIGVCFVKRKNQRNGHSLVSALISHVDYFRVARHPRASHEFTQADL